MNFLINKCITNTLSIIILYFIYNQTIYSQLDSIERSIHKQDTVLIRDSIIFKDSALITKNEIPTISRETYIITAVGDIMPGTDYPDPDYLPPNNDCMPSFKYIKEHLTGDIVFGNLEGSIAGEMGSPKNCKNPDACYVFRIPEEYIKCIKYAGFNLLSVANNHVNDFGPEGRNNSAKVLSQSEIYFAGFETHPYTIFEKEGIKYGFAAFAPNTGTLDMLNINNAGKIARHLDSICDVVIISMHGGAEGKDFQFVTRETEFFYTNNRGNVYNFAHAVIDAGADLVLGHGPHVTRGVEMYKKKFIAYSLGNFSTYKRFNISGPNGIAPILQIHIKNNGDFVKAKLIPVKQIGEGIPVYDSANTVKTKLLELTNHDFPEQNIIIDSCNWIYFKNTGTITGN